MNIRRTIAALSITLLALRPLPGVSATKTENQSSLVQIEYFFTPGCETCYRVDQEILPLLNAQYAGSYALTRCDINRESHYLRLAAYQDALSIDEHASSVLVVNGVMAFAGWPAIHDAFLDYVGQAIAGTVEIPRTSPPPAPAMTLAHLDQRVRNFTLLGVALAGLVDGINPCAISTLVFLISVLGIMKVRGKQLLWAGAAFCVTCFATYLAIGFGLFHILYLFSGFPWLRHGLEWGMITVLLMLAVLSLRDALRYSATGQAADVTLKLPSRITDRIHRTIRSQLSTHHLIGGCIITSFLVTVLESVCTGQVYVPTLILMLRSGQSTPLVLGYLLLYNTLFILPLLVALILAYRGTQTQRFVNWSRRNVVPSKVALAALFIALAALIAML